MYSSNIKRSDDVLQTNWQNGFYIKCKDTKCMKLEGILKEPKFSAGLKVFFLAYTSTIR